MERKTYPGVNALYQFGFTIVKQAYYERILNDFDRLVEIVKKSRIK